MTVGAADALKLVTKQTVVQPPATMTAKRGSIVLQEENTGPCPGTEVQQRRLDAPQCSTVHQGSRHRRCRQPTAASCRKMLLRRVPVLEWWRQYTTSHLVGDVVAGVSVGLMTVPQALAYSIVAGLPPNYGLYSAFMGSFLYLVFGTTAHLSIGPTAVMALITKQYTSQGGPDYAVLLAFVSGLLELLAAIVNLGFLANFISQPVISGFCSAAAVTIISSQMKALLGLKLHTHGVIDVWTQVVTHISETRWQDCVLGIVCILLLTLFKNLSYLGSLCCRPKPNESQRNRASNCQQKLVFLLSVGRNALVVVIASALAFALADLQLFTLTGFVEPGLPPFELPPFNPTVGNSTVTFLEAMQDVGAGVVVLPFIAILDNIAIIQSVYPGKPIDTTQEIAVLGLINIFGSLFGSMPTTGSLSRTAVNKSSGGRSPASGIITGTMVLLAAAFLTPAFRWIPRASLAAVIMCAVVHMIDVSLAMTLWKGACRKDLLVLLVTFVSCLVLGVEWGVLVGALVHLAMVLFCMARPTVKLELMKTKSGKDFVLAQPGHGVLYPSIGHLRTRVEKAGRKIAQGMLPVVVNCSYLQSIDYTAAKGLVNMAKDFHDRQQTLVYVNMASYIEKTVLALRESDSYPVHIVVTVEGQEGTAAGILHIEDLDIFSPVGNTFPGVSTEDTRINEQPETISADPAATNIDFTNDLKSNNNCKRASNSSNDVALLPLTPPSSGPSFVSGTSYQPNEVIAYVDEGEDTGEALLRH